MNARSSPTRAADAIENDARVSSADRLIPLGSLAGGIAHQINNALTHVQLSLGRLLSYELSRKPHTPSRLHRIELLRDVREGFVLVEGIARELSKFSRMDEHPVEPVDLRDVLESVMLVVENDVRHRASLVFDYGEVPPVAGNAVALRGVFLNLLLNAAQAIEAGRASENEIHVETKSGEAGRVVVEVRDTGVGIPADLIGKIFDPFFTTQPRGVGMGLGLSSAREVVQGLGGTISLVSVPGRGTTVRVELPASDVPRLRPVARQADVSEADEALMKRILIVDDDVPVANAIALELEGHDVVVAAGGREALDILRRDQSFDLVLCDLMMPDMTGMELYETIGCLSARLASRFVFMTGGAFTTRSQRFLDEVSNPRLQKPFDPGSLRALVRGLHASHKGK